MKNSAHSAFSLIELIFVIVIIGVLSAVAIPKFGRLTDNSKISSELATASSVQSALDSVHSEWITNSCDFVWGNEQNSSDPDPGGINNKGYPRSLENSQIFDRIFKTKTNDWTRDNSHTPPRYYGPATNPNKGSKNRNLENKPEIGEWWEYDPEKGTFTLKND